MRSGSAFFVLLLAMCTTTLAQNHSNKTQVLSFVPLLAEQSPNSFNTGIAIPQFQPASLSRKAQFALNLFEGLKYRNIMDWNAADPIFDVRTLPAYNASDYNRALGSLKYLSSPSIYQHWDLFSRYK
jgi:hypothetical protein